jgi:hypothetical protein
MSLVKFLTQYIDLPTVYEVRRIVDLLNRDNRIFRKVNEFRSGLQLWKLENMTLRTFIY